MNRRDCLKVTKTPDTTLNLGVDESIVLQTPVPKVRVSKSIEPVAYRDEEKDESTRSYFVYAVIIIPYVLFLYLVLRKSTDSAVVLDLVREINSLRQESIRMSEYIGKLRSMRDEVNYAKVEKGARVHIQDASSIFSYGLLGFRRHKDPSIIFDENVSAGECLAFKGSEFRFTVNFDTEVEISKVGLFHPITTDVSSAVYEFEVFCNTDDEHLSLGEFKYDASLCEFQTFEVKRSKVRSVDFVVKSNNGHKKYTCVYKVYLFGSE